MSETPDIKHGSCLETRGYSSCLRPDVESVFPEEEGGEEEFPQEEDVEDDVVGNPFLGPNPMTEIEFQFEDLFLVEVQSR